MLNKIYIYVASVVAFFAAIALTYFKGVSNGKSKAEAQSNVDLLKAQAEMDKSRSIIQDIVRKKDEESNDKTRDSLIDSLVADSLRK